LILTKLIKEFFLIDKSSIIGHCQIKLLNDNNHIRITNRNLAEIIKKAYSLHRNKNIKLKNKLKALFEYIKILLLKQNKILKLAPEYDMKYIRSRDINEIRSEIMQTNILNQNQFKPKMKERIKNLIYKILNKLPIVLVSKVIYKKEYISPQFIEAKRKRFNEDEIIINSDNVNLEIKKLLKEEESTKLLLNQQIERIGEGRKSRNKIGREDNTEIFDISSWPLSCKTNINQSPININKQYDPEILPLDLYYNIPKGKISFLNDGYKLILKINDLGKIKYGVHEYKTKEIHFHYPSEHTFGDDEKRSDLEMQIVHEDLFGNIAVVSVLFEIGLDDNLFLNELGFGIDNPYFAMRLRNYEKVKIKPSPNLNFGPLLKSNHYVSYYGSLTTPPCNKNVQWFILLHKLNVTQRQLDYFPVFFGSDSNVRGLQPRGSRTINIV